MKPLFLLNKLKLIRFHKFENGFYFVIWNPLHFFRKVRSSLFMGYVKPEKFVIKYHGLFNKEQT